MGGCAKVSPSPLASDRARKELPAEPLDEELVGSEQPLKAQEEQPSISWDDLPGSVLELVFNHLKRAAMAGEKVFLKSPDQQRRVTAVGVRLGAVCRLWREEALFIFFKDWWQAPNTIIHPRQCFSLAPKPQGLFQCSFLVVEDKPSMHCRYYLHQGTEQGKLLMTAEYNKEGNIVLYQNGKNWQDGARECAVVKVGRYNTHYALKPFAFDPSSSQRASLGDIRYVDRIKACLSPRKMQVTLPGRQALERFDPTHPGDKASVVGEGTKAKNSSRSNSRKGIFANLGTARREVSDDYGLTGHPKVEEQVLVNREPEFKPEFRGWCLNFKGRVQDPSVKNFQLVEETNPSELVLQFGRMKGQSYILDFKPYVISAAQAFAVALSNFHR